MHRELHCPRLHPLSREERFDVLQANRRRHEQGVRSESQPAPRHEVASEPAVPVMRRIARSGFELWLVGHGTSLVQLA